METPAKWRSTFVSRVCYRRTSQVPNLPLDGSALHRHAVRTVLDGNSYVLAG